MYSNGFLIRIIKKIIILLGFINIKAVSQNVCQKLPTNTVSGNFEISGNIDSGCSPFQIDLIDKSGGINIKYEFYYNGEDPSQLKKTGNGDRSNVYFSSKDKKTYTILQYGEKNGKPMYACKNITVLPSNKPKFSYSICSSQLEIAIPKAPENDFDSYKINWGSGNPEQIIQATQIPFSGSKPVNYPTQINVEGIYSSQTNQSCGNSGNITVQKLDAINFPNGYAPPFDPNIDEIISNSGTSISMKFKGSEDQAGYNLNMRKLDGVYPSNPFRTNVVPGNIDITLPDSGNVYCFYFTRVSGCGSFEESAEACILKLSDPKIEPGNINLQWSSYPQTNRDYTNEPNKHSFTKNIELEKDYNGRKSYIPIVSNATNYRDQAECVANLKYRVKLKTEGLLWGYKYQTNVYSDWKSIDASKIKAPAINDFSITVNNSNSLSLDFRNNTIWNTPIEKYYLYEITNNVPTLRDSVLVPGAIEQNDKDASLQTYCYKINYKDQCGIIAELSPEVCSLHLKLGLNNNLEWTLANPFAEDPVGTLEIESKPEETLNFSNPVITTPGSSIFSPDYSKFNETAYFRLKATSQSTQLTSFSNILEVPLKNSLLFPKAFSPNGDGINDKFFPVGNTSKITNYSMRIYDRWGSLLFESKSPFDKWNGKNKQGVSFPTNTYFAKIRYTDNKNRMEMNSLSIYILK